MVRSIDLLIVDDDDDFREPASRRFRARGYGVWEASGGDEALGLCNRQQFDVALIDQTLPGMSGIELLAALRTLQPDSEVVVLTGRGSAEAAVAATRAGAYDFLTKPVRLAELETRVGRAAERARLRAENAHLKEILGRIVRPTDPLGRSPAMQRLFEQISLVARQDGPVSIVGERGTGKGLIARTLQQQSGRAASPLVDLRCTMMPGHMLECELFGYANGASPALTGAKPGVFELADGGTLLVNEIGLLPYALQQRVVDVLESGVVHRIGSLRRRSVDVRLLTTSSQDLPRAVLEGQFYGPLYDRMRGTTLTVPPLRERRDDIRLLVEQSLGTG